VNCQRCSPVLHRTPIAQIGFVEVLSISSKLYADFVQLNNLYDDIERLGENWQFLENLDLLNEAISHLTLNKLVEHIALIAYPAKHLFDTQDNQLYLVKSGKVDIFNKNQLECITTGDFFGEASMFLKDNQYPTMQTSERSEIYQIPLEIIRNIPILNWKLFERHAKRMKLFFSI